MQFIWWWVRFMSHFNKRVTSASSSKKIQRWMINSFLINDIEIAVIVNTHLRETVGIIIFDMEILWIINLLRIEFIVGGRKPACNRWDVANSCFIYCFSLLCLSCLLWTAGFFVDLTSPPILRLPQKATFGLLKKLLSIGFPRATFGSPNKLLWEIKEVFLLQRDLARISIGNLAACHLDRKRRSRQGDRGEER